MTRDSKWHLLFSKVFDPGPLMCAPKDENEEVGSHYTRDFLELAWQSSNKFLHLDEEDLFNIQTLARSITRMRSCFDYSGRCVCLLSLDDEISYYKEMEPEIVRGHIEKLFDSALETAMQKKTLKGKVGCISRWIEYAVKTLPPEYADFVISQKEKCDIWEDAE